MRLIVTSILALLSVGAASAADVKGSADHALIPRYEGSEIISYGHQKFTDYRLMIRKATAYGGIGKNLQATMPLEGEVTRISYRTPADRSVLEVFRNYEKALQEAGFQPIFSCDKEACGGRNFNAVMAAGKLYSLFGEYQAEQRYLAAKLARSQGDVYVALYAVMNKAGGGPNKNHTMVQLDVIALKPMEEKMVVLDAKKLGSEIATEGRVAIYGILFDFDKANIKAESKAQLDEIATLLKKTPDLKVLIVGHTDAKGSLDYNQNLSEKRAQAVVKALTSQYGVAAARLTPVGVGMAAPVASNRTEEGRAKNRRVEIVER